LPKLRYYPGFCLEVLRITRKPSDKTAGLRAETSTGDLSNTKHEC
jgi:hypothetical protein